MIVEPQNESQRFLCELSRIRGFAWTDELPAPQATSPSEHTDFTDVALYDAHSLTYQRSILVPAETDRESPVERALQRSENAGFTSEENRARLEQLENLRAYTLRLIFGNPDLQEPRDTYLDKQKWQLPDSLSQYLSNRIPSGYYAQLAIKAEGPRIQRFLREAEIKSDQISKAIQYTRTLTSAIDASDPRWKDAFTYATDQIDQQQNELLRGNLRLVMKFAPPAARHIAKDTAIRAGISGLLTAISRFDSHHKTTLATYAVRWIQQPAQRLSQNHRSALRIPIQKMSDINKLWQSWYRLLATTHQLPSVEALKSGNFSDTEINTLIELSRSLLSVEQMTSQTGEPLGNRLYDPDRPAPSLLFKSQKHPGLLPYLLRKLENTPPSRPKNSRYDTKIVWHRHGIGISKFLTLEEIGAQYDVTREQIRQIEKKDNEKIYHQIKSYKFNLIKILSPYTPTYSKPGDKP